LRDDSFVSFLSLVSAMEGTSSQLG